MTTVIEEEVDYESDPEEVKRSLAMRRREASDDEEGEGEGREKPKVDRRVGVHSDESDGQGGAADYDDDEELGIEDEDDVEEEVDEEEEEVYDESGRESEAARGPIGVECSAVAVHKEADGDLTSFVEESVDTNVGVQGEEEVEKKENEPFAVPTAGAFYMHDDRFRDNAGGRHRYGSIFPVHLCNTSLISLVYIGSLSELSHKVSGRNLWKYTFLTAIFVNLIS